MNNSFLVIVFEAIIGFASGIAVGGGLIAFLMFLGIIPRLAQLSKTYHLINIYHICVMVGTFIGTYISFLNFSVNQHTIFLIIWGLFHGIFNGMLIAALAEVLNILPILSKRIQMKQYLFTFIMAIVFGKIVGSIFQWIVFVR